MLWREAAFFLSNVAIFLGYCFVAVTVMPSFPVKLKRTKWGGVFFFLTCGLTHLHLAAHTLGGGGFSREDLLSWHMLVVHIVQGVAVWFFVTGLYEEFGSVRRWSDKPSLDERLETMHNDEVR